MKPAITEVHFKHTGVAIIPEVFSRSDIDLARERVLSNLHLIPGSHKQDIALDSDDQAIPADLNQVQSINARAGDAVVLDVCTTHRGSKEGEESAGTHASHC